MRIFIRTSKTGEIQHYINTYSICSVARPRPTRVCKTPTAELKNAITDNAVTAKEIFDEMYRYGV